MKYVLEVGYGDSCWDAGYDHFEYDSLEELWEGYLENAQSPFYFISKEEFFEKMNAEGYLEDEEDGMWWAQRQ